MLLSDIVITDAFLNADCSPDKVEKAKNYFKENKSFDKPICLDPERRLVNGYSRYLAAKQIGLNEVPVVYGEEFVIGKFDYNPKTYVWRNDKHIPLKRGDRALVQNKNGVATVTIKKMFYAAPSKKAPERKSVLGVANGEKS